MPFVICLFEIGTFQFSFSFCVQIPGGLAAQTFNAKWVFGVGVLCTGVLTLLTPLAAHWSVAAFVALRILMGVGEGVTVPAMHCLLSRWVPLAERNRITVTVYSGANFGTVLAQPLSGYLCQYGPWGGWPSVFYLGGAVTCVWCVSIEN